MVWSLALQCYVLPVSWLTSHLCITGMSIALQRMTSLSRRAQINDPAASYWLRCVPDDGGRRV